MMRGAIAALTSAGLVAAPVHGPFGRGAAQVWTMSPAGPIRAVVVFGHGWKVAPPSASYPWVGQFRPWLDHLTARGDAVIFPRYQLGGDETGPARAVAFRAGVRTGLQRLGRPAVPVIAAGYSYGATLALTYAAEARAWHLPVPAAVDAVFPAGPIPGLRLPRPPASTRFLLQVGDRDVVAGAGGAQPFWAWLQTQPASLKQYVVIKSTAWFVADHAAPKGTSAAARAAFWSPLDQLVQFSRGTHP